MLSPPSWPMKAEFRERVQMDRNVYLFLFEMADGRPMAQYMDSLRATFATASLSLRSVETS